MSGSEKSLFILQVSKRELIPIKISDNMRRRDWKLEEIVC